MAALLALAGDNECEIDHQTPGRMSVSEGDVVVFLPYVHDDDDNWLAARRVALDPR